MTPDLTPAWLRSRRLRELRMIAGKPEAGIIHPAVALCDDPSLSPCVMSGIVKEQTAPYIVRRQDGGLIQLITPAPHARSN